MTEPEDKEEEEVFVGTLLPARLSHGNQRFFFFWYQPPTLLWTIVTFVHNLKEKWGNQDIRIRARQKKCSKLKFACSSHKPRSLCSNFYSSCQIQVTKKRHPTYRPIVKDARSPPILTLGRRPEGLVPLASGYEKYPVKVCMVLVCWTNVYSGEKKSSGRKNDAQVVSDMWP
jgi:hypothetical protein